LDEPLLYLQGREKQSKVGLGQKDSDRQRRGALHLQHGDCAPSRSLKLTAKHGDRDGLSDLPPELLEELSEEATREVAHPLNRDNRWLRPNGDSYRPLSEI
jgi:hypothetical protein